MRKYITLLLAFFSVGFLSCVDKQKQDDKIISFQRSDFKIQKVLSGKILEFDSLILRPSQIQVFDSFLVTCNQGADKQFHVFNLNTAHKEGECISVGQGPKEMMVPSFVNRRDSVVIFDMMTSTIFTYAISDFVCGEEPECISRISLDIKPLWSNLRCVNSGFLGVSYQAVSPCFLFDKSGKKIMNFGVYPKTEQEYTSAELVNVFRADLTTNLKNKIAITHYFTDLISVYNDSGELEKQLRGPDHFASVFKEFRDGDIIGSKAEPKTYRDAFYSPVSVDDKLFVLYNGKKLNETGYNILCKELFVFGWNGSLESHYTLDQGVSSIAVDSQNRKIYGISDDPEYHIVEFAY